MSLNQCEQMVDDYWQRQPDELRVWQSKVRSLAGNRAPDPSLVMALNADLWAYVEERSAVASPFKEWAAHNGLRKTSMLNLAEYLLRIWLPPRPAKKPTVPGAV